VYFTATPLGRASERPKVGTNETSGRRVAGLHIRLQPDDSCAHEARRFVNDQLLAVGEEPRENALLVASELVTNAYRHGSGRIEMRLKPSPGQLFIEVSDDGDPRGVAIAPGTDEFGGWGLRIVDELATDWGVRNGRLHPRRGRTRVWARIPLV
jgi:two-component sensor histidine kinase